MAKVSRRIARSTVTAKGQTTIPVEVRREFGIQSGDSLVYKREGDRLIVTPVHGSILDAAGSVPSPDAEWGEIRGKTKKLVGERAAKR